MIALRIIGGMAAALLCAAAGANPTHQHLVKLSATQRSAVFATLLRNAGQACPSVSKTFYQGRDRTGAVFWNVQCAGGKAWSIMIRNDKFGSARFLDCEQMEALDSVPCFRKF